MSAMKITNVCVVAAMLVSLSPGTLVVRAVSAGQCKIFSDDYRECMRERRRREDEREREDDRERQRQRERREDQERERQREQREDERERRRRF